MRRVYAFNFDYSGRLFRNWHMSFTLFSTIAWLFLIVPAIYYRGFISFILFLNSGKLGLIVGLYILCSIIMAGYALSKKFLSSIIGALSNIDSKLFWDTFINENMLLQYYFIALGQTKINIAELMIWGFISFFYTTCKSMQGVVKLRIQSNNEKNLKILLSIIISLIAIFMTNFILIFHSIGLNLILLATYEGFIVLFDSAYTLCILHYKLIPNEIRDLKLKILENSIRCMHWLQISYLFGNYFSFHPIHLVTLIKTNGIVADICSLISKYYHYKKSVKTFLKKYPALPKEQIEELQDEKCCICLDTISVGVCCKISCNHVFHYDCIRKLMMSTKKRICPLCKREFMDPENSEPRRNWSLWPRFLPQFHITFSSIWNNEDAIRQIREILPNVTEDMIRNEINRTGSIEVAIGNLIGNV